VRLVKFCAPCFPLLIFSLTTTSPRIATGIFAAGPLPAWVDALNVAAVQCRGVAVGYVGNARWCAYAWVCGVRRDRSRCDIRPCNRVASPSTLSSIMALSEGHRSRSVAPYTALPIWTGQDPEVPPELCTGSRRWSRDLFQQFKTRLVHGKSM